MSAICRSVLQSVHFFWPLSAAAAIAACARARRVPPAHEPTVGPRHGLLLPLPVLPAPDDDVLFLGFCQSPTLLGLCPLPLDLGSLLGCPFAAIFATSASATAASRADCEPQAASTDSKTPKTKGRPGPGDLDLNRSFDFFHSPLLALNLADLSYSREPFWCMRPDTNATLRIYEFFTE